MQTAAIAERSPPRDNVGTRHRLEALSILLDGGNVEEAYKKETVADMLQVFRTAREGFDFLHSPAATTTTLWPSDKIEPVKHAHHFEHILSGPEFAERIIRALEATLGEYAKTLEAGDEAKFHFGSQETEAAVREAVRGLTEMAAHIPVLPRDHRWDDFWKV